MMCHARLRPLVAVAVVLVLTIGGVAAQERQKPTPEEARKEARTASAPAAVSGGSAVADLPANRALARKQLALIDNVWDSLFVLYRHARVEISDGQFGQWGRRRLEVLHRTGAPKAEIVAAMEKYIKDLTALEAIAKAQKEAARGTELGVFETQYLRLEAEIWLNEEKAR